MSGINVSYDYNACKIGNGAGEMKFEEMTSENKTSVANIIAVEVVSEILETALDIATKANETGVHWKKIKEDKYNRKKKILGPPENVDSPESTLEPLPINVEIRNNLSEIIFPHPEIINGIGDQAFEQKTIRKNYEYEQEKNNTEFELETEKGKSSTDIELETDKVVVLEKKSRVTDLVKNSKQKIIEYIEDKHFKENQEEWELEEERVIKVIDLEHSESEVSTKCNPEDVQLPGDDQDLIRMPNDNTMDIIDLSSKAFKMEENQVVDLPSENLGGKGDEYNTNMAAVMPQNEPAENPKTATLKSHKELRDNKIKKKKWNIGTRLLNFLKRHPKQAEQAH